MLSHSHSHSHILTVTLTHTLPLMHTHTLTQTHTLTLPLMHSHTPICTATPTHSHSHSHSLTHIPISSHAHFFQALWAQGDPLRLTQAQLLSIRLRISPGIWVHQPHCSLAMSSILPWGVPPVRWAHVLCLGKAPKHKQYRRSWTEVSNSWEQLREPWVRAKGQYAELGGRSVVWALRLLGHPPVFCPGYCCCAWWGQASGPQEKSTDLPRSKYGLVGGAQGIALGARRA